MLFITSDFPHPYDPANGLFNEYLVRALSQEHQVRVVCPIPWTALCAAKVKGRAPKAHWRSQAEKNGIVHPVYYYPPKILHNHYGTFLWWSVRRHVRRLLRTFWPDVVVGYWAHPDGEIAVRVARQLGVPSGVIIGGSDVLLITKNPGRRRCVLEVLQATDAVITVNHHLKNEIVNYGICPEKVHSWNQGVDAKFSPADRRSARARVGMPQNGNMAVWVGRMVPVKALEVLLDACRLLKQSPLAFTLWLVGDGPLRGQLEARVAAEGLADNVRFVGTQLHDRLPDWYRAADFTLLPSWSEGLPNVLRESLACGTPFVASRVGGIPEIARNHLEWLFEAGDAKGLAAAMAQMWADPSLPPWSYETPTWSQSAQALMAILQPCPAEVPQHQVQSA